MPHMTGIHSDRGGLIQVPRQDGKERGVDQKHREHLAHGAIVDRLVHVRPANSCL